MLRVAMRRDVASHGSSSNVKANAATIQITDADALLALTLKESEDDMLTSEEVGDLTHMLDL